MTTGTKTDEWQGAEPVVFPWRGEETGVEIKEMFNPCPKCGEKLEQRGKIWEAFGAVEIRMLGACHQCRTMYDSRARLYPEKGTLMEMGADGKWTTTRMRRTCARSEDAWKETLRCMPFIIGGLAVGIMGSVACTEPKVSTVVGWVLSFLVVTSLVYSLEYWSRRR